MVLVFSSDNRCFACTDSGVPVYVSTDSGSSVTCWRLQNFTVQPGAWSNVVIVTAAVVVENTAGSSLVSGVAVASL